MDLRSRTTFGDVVRTCIRLLTFRSTREELLQLGTKHLTFGLICTWLVGMGRYWDDPGASLLQKLGLGSVLYIFFLAGFLWLMMYLLRPQDWTFRRVLTFISLVSPPAILYAIPVERFMTLEDARLVNVCFLATVATWRVALLVFFLVRLGRLGWTVTIIGSLFPLAVIVSVLTYLNLERAVFDVMAGLREDGTANDLAYEILAIITTTAVVLSPNLLIGYVVAALIAGPSKR